MENDVCKGRNPKEMYLTFSGDQLLGNWDEREIITGTISGNVFTGKYYHNSNPSLTHDINITLSSGGQTFDCSYIFSDHSYILKGVKDNSATALVIISKTGADPKPFSGTWSTTSS